MEQPCFRVQPGHFSFVRDFDFGTKFNEPIECSSFRCANVGSGDDSQYRPVLAVCSSAGEFGELFLNDSKSVPFHKSAQQIDSIGRRKFSLNLGTNPWLLTSVHE